MMIITMQANTSQSFYIILKSYFPGFPGFFFRIPGNQAAFKVCTPIRPQYLLKKANMSWSAKASRG